MPGLGFGKPLSHSPAQPSLKRPDGLAAWDHSQHRDNTPSSNQVKLSRPNKHPAREIEVDLFNFQSPRPCHITSLEKLEIGPKFKERDGFYFIN